MDGRGGEKVNEQQLLDQVPHVINDPLQSLGALFPMFNAYHLQLLCSDESHAKYVSMKAVRPTRFFVVFVPHKDKVKKNFCDVRMFFELMHVRALCTGQNGAPDGLLAGVL